DYEPIAGGPVRAIPQGFTCWDKVEDLTNFLETHSDVYVTWHKGPGKLSREGLDRFLRNAF
ncbi:hypothetical protein EAH_00054830, partial [Eimeria acervulina]